MSWENMSEGYVRVEMSGYTLCSCIFAVECGARWKLFWADLTSVDYRTSNIALQPQLPSF